jgi:surface protein
MAVGNFNTPSTNITQPITPWVRPSDWLAIPTPGTQEVIGLLAIFDDINYIALECTGAYTVDWGDGTSTNHASGTRANKTYAYSGISSATTTTLGYRQALVRITPQSGQNLSSVNFGVQNTGFTKAYSVGWLDVDIRLPNGTMYFNGHQNLVRYSRLEKIVIRELVSGALMGNLCNNMWNLRSIYIEPNETANTSNFVAMFGFCYSLEEAPFMNTISATSMTNMFNACNNLKSVPLYNTANVTNMESMFYQCRSLEYIPPFNTGKVTTMTTMFQNCTSLKAIPLLDTSNVTLAGNMFNTCTALESVPALNLGKVANFGGFLSTCYSLRSIGLMNTSAATSFNTFATTCTSLEEVALLDTSKVLDFNSAFFGCVALEKLPQFNTSAATNFSNIVNGCGALLEIPLWDTTKVTTFNLAFNNCLSLRRLPALNVSASTVFTNFLGNNVSIGKSEIYGARYGNSYTNMALSQVEIVNIFTNLGTAVGAQTINVSTNPGRAALTAGEIAIATGKGWTVL